MRSCSKCWPPRSSRPSTRLARSASWCPAPTASTRSRRNTRTWVAPTRSFTTRSSSTGSSGRQAHPGAALRRVIARRSTYHDPCFLGRHNKVYNAPRELLGDKDVVEMELNHERAMCCGAGGAHAFFEDKNGTSVSGMRTRQAMATGAEVIATACPFCTTMLNDGVRGEAAEIEVRTSPSFCSKVSSEARPEANSPTHSAVCDSVAEPHATYQPRLIALDAVVAPPRTIHVIVAT